MAEPGLRERKKRRTRETITEAAFTLFQESGFDNVSVVDIATAAEVSKPTLFAYFPTKEDLILRRFLDDDSGPAIIVRNRTADTSALRALRQDFLERLAHRDTLTGLDDSALAITFHELLYSTPTLMARLTGYMLDQERKLAEELCATGGVSEKLTARILAAQIFGIQRILSTHNAEEIRSGRRAEDIHPAAIAQTEAAYDRLERGCFGDAAG
ncbi:TetR/AcrR family transcriptional regulator [Sciscionella marina]|uniref:TetR/AcrR family transcriptional regulator n=1 Tax=Sciscionella marina TaxID=508770 RepID=UPI00037C62A4|nr:TetR/AcrR family transcriptional regulator [Sciscionella marina]